MAEFISKIQYKTCEKGEFFDEQPRTLNETLALIKTFPWDIQRGADVQLSGPGIVIESPNGDYLKIALYFNGKFNAYYLDAANHLYEHHTSNLDDDCSKVKEFFENQLNLGDFEKHFFNIGNRAHFKTHNFEYTVTLGLAITFPLLLGLYILFIAVAVAQNSLPVAVIIALFTMLVVISASLYRYFNYKNFYLKLSKGHDDFLFGTDREHIQLYNKQDIKEIIIYEHRSARRRSNIPSQIIFKDGSVITLPVLLISHLRLMSKFSDNLVRLDYVSRWP